MQHNITHHDKCNICLVYQLQYIILLFSGQVTTSPQNGTSIFLIVSLQYWAYSTSCQPFTVQTSSCHNWKGTKSRGRSKFISVTISAVACEDTLLGSIFPVPILWSLYVNHTCPSSLSPPKRLGLNTSTSAVNSRLWGASACEENELEDMNRDRIGEEQSHATSEKKNIKKRKNIVDHNMNLDHWTITAATKRWFFAKAARWKLSDPDTAVTSFLSSSAYRKRTPETLKSERQRKAWIKKGCP